MADDVLLLTGATGFLGGELLARLLVEEPRRRMLALVRADDDAAAQARLDGIVEGLGGAAGDVEAVRAELTAPHLGLSPAAEDALRAEVTTIVHCAASVSFTLPLGPSRQINVDGTRRMLALARRSPRLERFVHVSTAYVAGRARGAFGGDDLERGQPFRNAYEESKHEAEVLVREAARQLPAVQVVRPSIVVGDRATGWTSSFNVVYQPLRAFSRGLYEVLPGDLDAPVDVVSVDYVADAMLALLGAPPRGGLETFPLVAGADAASVGELVGLAARYYDREPPAIVPPALFHGLLAPIVRRRGEAARAVLEKSAVYFPYFAVETRFEDEAARGRMAAHGLAPSPLRDYLPRLLDFAAAARWGKRLPTRASVVAT